MEGDIEGVPCFDRAPSRAGHRPSRPPMKRSNASYNAFPDLPPIRNSPTPPLDNSSSTDSGSSSDSEDDFNIDLAPLCPPSPPSPTSPCSESSDSLFSPLDQEDWERVHDGFAPPALQESYSPSWPATPPPRLQLSRGPLHCAHYGWSNNALHEMKFGLWYRRQWVWWHYEEHCRYLDSFRTDATDDGVAATIFYPPPPVLFPSRHMPWMSANGRPLPSSERIRAQPVPAADAVWKMNRDYFKPIYPRFGDIDDLRDASCEEQDRRYHAVPAFKLRQFVYLSEMDALQGRPRKPDSLAPPSPLARCWTPDSPASVYSQDGAPVDSPTTTTPVVQFGEVDTSNAASPIMTQWRFRWRTIERLFPSPPPPPLHAHPFLPHWFPPPPPSPPQRPGTPLPDELPSTSSACMVSIMEVPAHEDDGSAGDTSIVSVAPAPLSDDASYTEISVHLPTPLAVQCPVGVRPPTPSVERGPTSTVEGTSLALDPEPVVRLPSPASTRGASLVVSPIAISGGSRMMTTSTLAQELERAAEDEASVRFSVSPVPLRPASPRLSSSRTTRRILSRMPTRSRNDDQHDLWHLDTA